MAATAEKEANDHFRFCERKLKFGVSNVMRPQFLDIRSEKNQRGESRRRDRITLRNSFHRVADGIELVGHYAHLFGKLLITAMPPALSVIGPNESSEMIIPAIDNIDITAIAIP